jgi:hypothetical protein
MAQQSIKMHFQFSKSLETVFSELSDHEFFGKTCGISMKRVKDGEDAPNGLGSIREINIGPLPSFEETITKFEPNRHIEYKITKGSPIKNHVGTLDFKETKFGCELDYEIKLESKIPLTTGLIKAVLKQGISKGLNRYARV